MYDYSGGSASHDALSVVSMEQSDGMQAELTRYTAYIYGDCLQSGDTVTLQVHNKSGSGGNIYMASITGLEEAPEGTEANTSECE